MQVRVLLGCGADPSVLSVRGETAFHVSLRAQLCDCALHKTSNLYFLQASVVRVCLDLLLNLSNAGAPLVRQEGGLLDVFGPHFAQDIDIGDACPWFDENMYPLWYPDTNDPTAAIFLHSGSLQATAPRWEQQLVCSQMLFVAYPDMSHLCRANIFGHTPLHLVSERLQSLPSTLLWPNILASTFALYHVG
jgi:hypothetical protein